MSGPGQPIVNLDGVERHFGAVRALVGVDLVEVNPYLDPAELTPHMAVQLLIETVATRFDPAR